MKLRLRIDTALITLVYAPNVVQYHQYDKEWQVVESH